MAKGFADIDRQCRELVAEARAGSFKSADEEVVTIRPALVQHGRLLKKGTAAG